MPVHNENPMVPQLLLERLAAGDLDPKRSRSIRSRLEQEPGGMERLAALTASNDAILSRYAADHMLAAIARKKDDAERIDAARADREKRASSTRWMVWGAPAMLAAIVAVVTLRGGPVPVDDGALSPATDRPLAASPGQGNTIQDNTIQDRAIDDGHRSKGLKAHLQVFRKRGEDAEKLRHGQAATAGDLIQLRYVAGEASHGAILSIDGRGEVTLHYPESEDGDLSLEPGKAIALPHAYELDDAPRFERFVFITAAGPFDLGVILDAARSIKRSGARAEDIALDLPDGLWQSSFVVKKVEP